MARTLTATSSSDNPKSLAILDDSDSIGGTWAAERLYPGLKTNNIVGSYEFSDFPMKPERYGLTPGQHIPGPVVHEYLTDFARHFGLDKLFRPHTKVETASLQEDGSWQLDYTCLSKDGPEPGRLTCDKLVIATGLTSEARMPTFPGGSSGFKGPLFHAKDLHARARDLRGCEDVVVVGGNKSAWDVCYAVATVGGRAHMVIRRSGGGPSWVWRPMHMFGAKLTLARLSSTRLFTCFDPTPFGTSFASLRRFLHGTILGGWLTWLFWAALDFLAASATGYGDPRLSMLRPWTSTFWMGNSLSTHNYETDWFELVREGRIIVHHADVTSLDETVARLSDGSKLKADAVVCCTGWKCRPPIRFEPEGMSEDLGLPREVTSHRQMPADVFQCCSSQLRSETISDKEAARDQRDSGIHSCIHAQIRARCPQLGFSPKRTLPRDDKTHAKDSFTLKFHSNTSLVLDFRELPYRLYRFLVPSSPRFLELRNIAFIGMHRSVHAVMVAQAQALWIACFFENQLVLEHKAVRYETVSHTEYERLRRPRESGGSGFSFPDLVFDSISYIDLLLEDLGLRTMRKRTLWQNLVEPHLPLDYQGLIEEWLVKRRE
jgi:hypothetical protein